MRSAARGACIGVALATVAAGCGVPAESEARPIPSDELPAALSEPETTTTTSTTIEPVEVEWVQLYYVRDGLLVPTVDELPPRPPLPDVIEALLLGPDPTLVSDGLRSTLGGPEVVAAVTLAGGVATVDLTLAYTQLPVGDQVLGLGEIVMTATARPGVGQVVFTLEGQVVEVPRADGTIVAGPVSRDDYRALVGS